MGAHLPAPSLLSWSGNEASDAQDASCPATRMAARRACHFSVARWICYARGGFLLQRALMMTVLISCITHHQHIFIALYTSSRIRQTSVG